MRSPCDSVLTIYRALRYYDERRFLNAGIKHVDMYFLDGSCPPEPILRKFIEVRLGSLNRPRCLPRGVPPPPPSVTAFFYFRSQKPRFPAAAVSRCTAKQVWGGPDR